MNDEEKKKHFERAEVLIAEQNFAAAVIAGAIAAILAAIAYGITVTHWAFAHVFAVAGVGVVVGFATGFLGRGISSKFGWLAAGYTIAGCLLGNIFAEILARTIGNSTSPVEVLQSESFSTIAAWAVSGLSAIDLVFWFVAVFVAVFLAKRALSRSDRLAIGLYESRSRS